MREMDPRLRGDVRVRFAPSPTGYLHVGNVRTALVNWLFAKHTGGQFVLRIDDTDIARSRPEYEKGIREDLHWLGLHWDSEERQSTRHDNYNIAFNKLADTGRLYPCYETSEELDVQRKIQASRGLPPIYKRTTEEQAKKYQAEGRKPHYRFSLNDELIEWDDLIRGPVSMRASTMSDPILVREDMLPLYTLASVVDDGEMNITHVIRGEDHVSNTAVQVQLAAALGFASPRFAHLALLKTKEGGLSKREGGGDIRSLRESGLLPMAVNSYLGRIGTSDPIEPLADLQPLIRSFDFSKFSRAPAHYDEEELARLNEKLTHHLPFAAVQAALPFADEAFWLSVRGNVKTLAEAKTWWDALHGDVHADLNHDERAFLRTSAALLPPEPWDGFTWNNWISAIQSTTPRKGKELFMPLRRALTGMDHGPEMKTLLPLLGREKALSRLK